MLRAHMDELICRESLARGKFCEHKDKGNDFRREAARGWVHAFAIVQTGVWSGHPGSVVI